ncbi:MAG: UDP-2,3-diacylglucosamine diphosphatase [Methylococcales bacterium]|nr:UDP-2,3-diacylglucosamine diphosphatase [Methylococcales bacterium]
MTLHYRTIWMSNTHLGTKACKADYLRDFLDNTESDYLYLVGDKIDFSPFTAKSHAAILHGDIVQRLINKAKNGTRVIYIPGNYAAMLRQQVDTPVNAITMVANALHTTADGRKLLVLHGDEFDNIVRYSELEGGIDNKADELLLVLNRWLNRVRSNFGYEQGAVSAYLTRNVKHAINFIHNYEHIRRLDAQMPQVDGIVCGHIHPFNTAEKILGKTYSHCGDWVESCSVLVEDARGTVDLIHWQEDSHWLLDAAAIAKNKIPAYHAEESSEWLFFSRQ